MLREVLSGKYSWGMSGKLSGAEAHVYVISCRRLDLVRIGVAGDARKRLRELQVGFPLELTLAHTWAYGERRDADAVAEELYRFFARRRDRGSWYRLTVAEVREGLGRRATREAPDRARAAAEAAARESPVAPRRVVRLRARTEKQLAYERRRRQERTRKQKRAAKLLAQGLTQQAVAAELGVTTRTLRNWKAAPAFHREQERQHKYAARPPAAAPSSKAKPPARRDAQDTPRAPPRPPDRRRPPRLASSRPAASATSTMCRSGATATAGRAHPRNTPSATPTTPLAATDPRPTATTKTRSSARADRGRKARPPPRANTKPRDRTRQTQHPLVTNRDGAGTDHNNRHSRHQSRRALLGCRSLQQKETIDDPVDGYPTSYYGLERGDLFREALGDDEPSARSAGS